MTSQWKPPVIAAMWWHEVRRYARDRTQIFGGASRTVLWLVILGGGLGAALGTLDGVPYAAFVLPGVIALNVLFSSLQCAIALVRDRESGTLREALVSPAPMASITLGKLLGGATIALAQGSIPLAFAPFVGVQSTVVGVVGAWGIMFVMGFAITGFGVVLATRLRSLEGFGAISNGVIQPSFFLSASVFPLAGTVVRGATEDGWVVQSPAWLDAVVRANPVSYHVDLLRTTLVGLRQLPLHHDLLVAAVLPVAAVVMAVRAMGSMRRR